MARTRTLFQRQLPTVLTRLPLWKAEGRSLVLFVEILLIQNSISQKRVVSILRIQTPASLCQLIQFHHNFFNLFIYFKDGKTELRDWKYIFSDFKDRELNNLQTE